MADKKPCPWCGGQNIATLYVLPKQSPYQRPELRDYFAQCVGCRASGPQHREKDAAVAAWNQISELGRAVGAWQDADTAPQLVDVLTCRFGRANSCRVMYRGDGSSKHPDGWICCATREIVPECLVPDLWKPLSNVP